MAPGLLLFAAAAVLGLTGYGMIKQPSEPPLGWRLGGLPAPGRMRALGWIVLGCASVMAVCALLVAALAIQG